MNEQELLEVLIKVFDMPEYDIRTPIGRCGFCKHFDIDDEKNMKRFCDYTPGYHMCFHRDRGFYYFHGPKNIVWGDWGRHCFESVDSEECKHRIEMINYFRSEREKLHQNE